MKTSEPCDFLISRRFAIWCAMSTCSWFKVEPHSGQYADNFRLITPSKGSTLCSVLPINTNCERKCPSQNSLAQILGDCPWSYTSLDKDPWTFKGTVRTPPRVVSKPHSFSRWLESRRYGLFARCSNLILVFLAVDCYSCCSGSKSSASRKQLYKVERRSFIWICKTSTHEHQPLVFIVHGWTANRTTYNNLHTCEISNRLSPELALHGLIVSEPMDVVTLDQLVDLIELRPGEGDRSRRQVLENTTLITRGNR